MATTRRTTVPTLVVAVDGKNIAVPLDRPHCTVGRSDQNDLTLPDQHVSRRHASLRTQDGYVILEDLGSTSGTRVNGRPVRDPVTLRDGDVIDFAGVRARFDDTVGVADETVVDRALPTQPESTRRDASPSPANSASFSVRNQRAENLSNVGRDQHNQYVQQVIHERQSFLRDVAATKTRATRLIVVGFVMLAVGIGGYAVYLVRSFGSFGELDAQSSPDDVDFFGENLLGIPAGLWFFLFGLLGQLLLIVGIVLHIVAAARRRRVDRDLPAPRPSYGRGEA